MKPRLKAFLLAGTTLFSQAAERPPNVIVIMADDISARDFPIYGSTAWAEERAATPVIDQLATEGCFIHTAWSSTVCMPTRAMVMSGRYPHLTKWWDNGEFGRGKGGIYEVPDSSPLGFGQIAKRAGYRSIWAGKTHVTSGSSHTKFGFDEGIFTPGEPEVRGTSPHPHFQNVKNPEFWNSESYLWWPEVHISNPPGQPTESVTWAKSEISDFGPDIELQHIFDFMDRAKKDDKPFFVYHTSHLGHQAVDMADPKFKMTWPGTPKITWNPETQTYTRHHPKITPKGPVNTLTTTYQKENITPNTLKSHIEYLDFQVSLYLKKLKEMGDLENTIVIFTADNGTRGWKASVEKQRGVHVPFIVSAPGQKHFVKGEQHIISDLADLLPTLADIMGTPLPPEDEYELSGKSLWPYLTQEQDHHRDWIYGFKGHRQMIRGKQVMRDGNGNWWDISKTPANLDNFPSLKNFSESQRKEKETLEKVMSRFAREDIGGPNSFHADPSRKISQREIDKMRAKSEARKRHFERMKK